MKVNRMGETNMSNQGYEMKIIEYNNAHDIIVEFQDEYKAKIHTQYSNFKNGEVKNPFYPSIYGIGYIGIGKYKIKENGKITKAYKCWNSMFQRCYEPYTINKYPTYIDCYVCELWHCFQNFAKWYEENMYECNDEYMELDKDILCKGNKIYSPETCIIVPHRINSLFTKSNTRRGEFPIGVCWHKTSNKFMTSCSFLNENGKKKKKNLGIYNTVEEAFLTYKNFKEKYIKEIADEYKDLIPQKLYEAMYKYEIEIND